MAVCISDTDTNSTTKQLLQTNDKLIESITDASSRQITQFEIVQAEKKEWMNRCRELERQQKEEWDTFPAEWQALRRSVSRFVAQPDKGMAPFFHSVGQLLDWAEKKRFPEDDSLYKACTYLELYTHDIGLKPNTLVGKLFPKEIAQLRTAILRETGGLPTHTYATESPVKAATTPRKRKKPSPGPSPTLLLSPRLVKPTSFQIDCVVLSVDLVQIFVRSMVGLDSIYLSQPKAGKLVALTDSPVIQARRYFDNNFTEKQTPGLIFVGMPLEPDTLPVICYGAPENTPKVALDPELKVQLQKRDPSNMEDVVFRYNTEHDVSKQVRSAEEQARPKQWTAYRNWLPNKGGITGNTTGADRKEWKGLILSHLKSLIHPE